MYEWIACPVVVFIIFVFFFFCCFFLVHYYWTELEAVEPLNHYFILDFNQPIFFFSDSVTLIFYLCLTNICAKKTVMHSLTILFCEILCKKQRICLYPTIAIVLILATLLSNYQNIIVKMALVWNTQASWRRRVCNILYNNLNWLGDGLCLKCKFHFRLVV